MDVNSQKKLVTNFATNSPYPMLRFVRLVVAFNRTNYNLIRKELEELISRNTTNLDWDQVFKILGTKDLRRVLFHFLDYGATTPLILQHRLKLDDSKVYRYIRKLRSLDIIEKAIRMPRERHSRGGPRATVYKVPDANIDQVTEAINLHRKLLSPKYTLSEEMAQLIFEEYIEPRNLVEIRERDIHRFLIEKQVVFIRADISELMIPLIQKQGVRVLRYGG